MQYQAIVLAECRSQIPLAMRTIRSIRRVAGGTLGELPIRVVVCDQGIGSADRESQANQWERLCPREDQSTLLLRAGVWFTEQVKFQAVPISYMQSQTRDPLIAFGVRKQTWAGDDGSDITVNRWREFLSTANPGSPDCPYHALDAAQWSVVWISSDAIKQIDWINWWPSPWQRLHEIIAEANGRFHRVVRWPSLDHHYDSRLRVAQIITSLQRGGAERIALDLHQQWLRRGIPSKLVVIDRPSREPFDHPPGVIDCSSARNRDDRVDRAIDALRRFQPDVVHSHLLSQAEQAAVGELGIPSLATLHNMKPGWPNSVDMLNPNDLNLWVGCSREVEREMSANTTIPTRTVWNGIDGEKYRTPLRSDRESVSSFRSRYSIPDSAFVVLSLANPRPQKCLERIPRIVKIAQQMLEDRGSAIRIHVLFAGEASATNTAAQDSLQRLRRAIQSENLQSSCHRIGAVRDVSTVLHESDLLLSTSLHEGLSLAYLEALACGIPVIATRVGGTREVETFDCGLSAFEPSDSDEVVAEAIVARVLSNGRIDSREENSKHSHSVASNASHHPIPFLPVDFNVEPMADGYERLYRGVLLAKSDLPKETIWLITNNLSIGGAQSSARRLILGMAERGISVGVVVLQEDQDNPTPGTKALRQAGIEVLVAPKVGTVDAHECVLWILNAFAPRSPHSVLFWNLIPEFKILLADILLGVQVIDVSPGEMNFSSLDRYFSKPRVGSPYRSTSDYGARLKGAVVKFEREQAFAEKVFGTDVAVIPNGVDIPESACSLTCRSIVRIGTSSRIHPHKRLEDLIDAFSEVVNRIKKDSEKDVRSIAIELHIAGGVDGDQDAYAEALRIASDGLPVRWLGHVNDVNSFLRSLDLFVMISEPAGCPNAMLEAMAIGLPIIATDVGGASEQVESDVNGILVRARDRNALAEAMTQLVNEPTLRIRYGAASRDRAMKRFSLERMIEDYLGVLNLPHVNRLISAKTRKTISTSEQEISTIG